MITEQQLCHWVRLPEPAPHARIRLFCFPYAGGSASVYFKWSYILSSLAEVCLIELPGRGYRAQEAPLTRMPILIDKLAQALAPWLDKPFAFFGHSMVG